MNWKLPMLPYTSSFMKSLEIMVRTVLINYTNEDQVDRNKKEKTMLQWRNIEQVDKWIYHNSMPEKLKFLWQELAIFCLQWIGSNGSKEEVRKCSSHHRGRLHWEIPDEIAQSSGFISQRDDSSTDVRNLLGVMRCIKNSWRKSAIRDLRIFRRKISAAMSRDIKHMGVGFVPRILGKLPTA